MDAPRRKKWPLVVGIVAGVLVIVVVIASFVLDSVLTSKAHEQAAQYSQQLGRPITIGSVSTKVLTGFGATVKDVSVGPGAGEGLPLAQVKSADVRVGLWRAIFSAGKDIVVRSAEVDGLNVNLIRFDDGTTNLERLQNKLAQTAPKEEKAPAERKQSDLSNLRVDHAALRDARIALVDKTGGGQRELAIQHLDVKVDDLRAGKALDVVVTAAVLADQKNFDLRLHTAPLPPSLVPTPERLTLKVQPIDLSPLAPFISKDVALQAGQFDANLDAQLGAAVAGGKGATSVQGTMHATGLKFAGAEGGKALDVVLDTDLKGDADKGDLQISKLRLDLGPAGITGQGRASGLNTQSPRIEGLEIRSHDLDPARLAAYYPPLSKQLGGQIAGPIGILLHAAGTQAGEALEMRVDFTPVKINLPHTMTKAAGAPMALVAHLRGAGKDKLAFDANLDLSGADLRPGQSLNKAPGQKLGLSAKGTRTSSGTTADPHQRIDLESVALQVLDDRMDARGFVEMKGAADAATKRFDLQVNSDRLDLDKILLSSDQKKKEEQPPPDPKSFAGLSGHAAVKIANVTYKKQQFQNVTADVTMKGDEIDVQTASIQGLGGQIDAGGTRLKLAHPKEPWHLATKIRGIDLEKAAAMSSPRKVLAGKFDGSVVLDGTSDDLSNLTKSLSGVLDGNVAGGKFYGKDIVASAAAPVMSALPGLRGKVTQGGETDLGQNLPFGFTVKEGWARLKAPIKVATQQAEMSFGGGVRLDGTLDMPGTVSLTPATVQQLTGGRVKLTTNVPVGLRLVGPAAKPSITDIDAKSAIEAIAKSAGSSLVSSVLGGTGDQKQQQAQSQAQQAADKAKEDAANKLKGLFGR